MAAPLGEKDPLTPRLAPPVSSSSADGLAAWDGAAAWEVTLIRRRGPRQRPRVVGCLHFGARDATTARRIAEDGLARRAVGDGCWALGPLRPLAPAVPGTHPYEVIFALWHEEEDGFVRDDVFAVTVWATDGRSARRLATTEAQGSAGYRGAWRIREARRADDPRPPEHARPATGAAR